MKRALAAVGTAALLVACGSTADEPAASGQTPRPSVTATSDPVPTEGPASPLPAGSTTPTSTASPGAPAPTLTSSTPVPAAPLRLGVVASDRTTFDKLLTSRGKLGTRAVTPVWVSSCEQLVGVDLALVQGRTCPGKAFPVLAAGPGLGELTPTISSLTSLTVDARIRLVLTRALAPATGPLGVVVETCPVNQQAVTKTLTPVARQRGFTVAATATVPCGKGTEAGKAVAQLQAKDVDQVVFVSGEDEAGLVRAFTKAAKAKGFAPLYGLTSAASPATLADQRDRVVGVGWLPSLDSSAATVNPTINDCLRAVRVAGADRPATPAQRFSTYGACDLLGLADRVLRLTRGSTDPAAVRAAVRATGRLFKAATGLESSTDFRTRQTGPALGRPFAWSPTCTCVAYTGTRSPL